MDKIYKEYVVTKNLKVIVEEGANEKDCCLLSIKHTPTPTKMNGEIIFASCELPELIKTLTRAALDASLRDNYLAGQADVRDSLTLAALAEMEKLQERNPSLLI